MYCTHCGTQHENSARFCSQCGQGTGVYSGSTTGYYAPRRIYRLIYDKSIAGVCSGIAKYLDIDVTLVRIAVVAAALFTGVIPGIVAYIIAMILMPKDYGTARPAQAAAQAATAS